MRSAREQAIFVTNDYLALDSDFVLTLSNLQATACGRRERAEHLVRTQPTRDLKACIEYLSDPQVRMLITVQQMVFDPRTGELLVEIP